MFDFVRNHQKLMQFVLLLLITPAFVLLGLEGYKSASSSANAYAKVGEYVISPEEFDLAKRRQIEEARAQSGPNFDPKLFDTPEANRGLLEGLVFQQLMQQSMNKQYLTSSDALVREQIAKIPAFQKDGKFDLDVYKALLAEQGLSSAQYESDVRFELARRQVLNPVLDSVFLGDKLQKNLNDVQLAGRFVQYKPIESIAYMAQVKVTDEQVSEYYENNKALFMRPEKVDVSFVVLSPDAIKASIEVNDAEVQQYYEQNKARFTSPEERRVRHILFGGPKEVEADLKAKAEKVLMELKADPSKFSQLVKQYSNDTASAAEGGDLGFFGKTGAMVPEFENAAFSQKKGELGLVKTQFGFHILEVTDLRGGVVQPLDSLKAQIVADIRAQKATVKIAEAQSRFSELVYEGAQSFENVEKAFGLKTQTYVDLTKPVGKDAPVVLKDAKVLSEVFSENSIKGKNNTKALQVGDSWVSVRVTKHVEAMAKPLADVRAEILNRLKQDEALKLASKEAGQVAETLNGLKQAPTAADLTGFGGQKMISVLGAEGVPRAVAEAVFKLPVADLPKAQTVDVGAAGFIVVWVSAVAPVEEVKAKVDPQMFKFYEGLSSQAYQKSLLLASRDALKKRISVDIKKTF
jgi:peptidyl-prolyl cis-trans isomerase D